MRTRSTVIAVLILLVVSLGLNSYLAFRLSRDEPQQDLISVPSSADEQALLFHALTALDALEGIGASIEDLNAAAGQVPGEDAWQACLVALNRSSYQLIGAAAQFEETLELVGQDHPGFIAGGTPRLNGAAVLLAAGDATPSYEEILEKINALASDLARLQESDPASGQILLQQIMTDINQAWTITASEMQVLYQFYYELARELNPGG